MSRNRISQTQPDHILQIVKRPKGWRPRNYYEVPLNAEIVSQHNIASYEEAHDDLKRCNQHSLRQDLDTWAIVATANAEF